MLTYMNRSHISENNNSTHYVYYLGKSFCFFWSNFVLLFQKEKLNRYDVFALIWSGDWLPWLEYEFYELFSVLFMRMNAYDPITALYYATDCITAENSNFIEFCAVSSSL